MQFCRDTCEDCMFWGYIAAHSSFAPPQRHPCGCHFALPGSRRHSYRHSYSCSHGRLSAARRSRRLGLGDELREERLHALPVVLKQLFAREEGGSLQLLARRRQPLARVNQLPVAAVLDLVGLLYLSLAKLHHLLHCAWGKGTSTDQTNKFEKQVSHTQQCSHMPHAARRQAGTHAAS